MSKKLTPEYIRLRTKCEKLEGIKNLNLWGCDLEDISIIRDLPNLEVVSLSINKIKTLRDFANLRYLRELYIRKNMVSDLDDVNYLRKCNNLRTLWLNENPLAENKNYRAFVIKTLPQIVKLDDIPITNEERNSINNLNFDDLEINDNEDNLDQEPQYEEEYKTEKTKNNQKSTNFDERQMDSKPYIPYNYEEKPLGSKQTNNYDERPIGSKPSYNFDERPIGSKPSYNFDEKPIGSKPSFNYDERPIGSKPVYKQPNDNGYQAKRSETKKGTSPNLRSNSDLNDNENERKKYRPEKDEIKPVPKVQLKTNEVGSSGKIKNETVVNCVMMLINELGIEDVEKIKREVDKIINNYYDEN